MGVVSRHKGEDTVSAVATAVGRYTLSAELIATLNASPDIQILLSPDQTILFANAAFLAANPDEAGPLVGRSLADSLMGRDGRRAASRRIILNAVRQAAAGEVVQPPPFRYDVQKDLSQPPRETWWSLSASPCDLADGPGLLLTARDVTAAVAADGAPGAHPTPGAPAEQAEPLEWAERRRLSQMFDQAPDMMSLVVGPDHVFELINPAMRRTADAQLLGRSLRDIVRSDRGREIVRRLDEVWASGRPYVARAQPFRMTAEADEDRFLDLTLQPLINEEGRVEAIFCRGQDVTEQVRALAVQRFLREELAHRNGNILAVVLALAEQSAAQAPSLEHFRGVFAGRLSALAALNTLLNRQGPDVSLADILGAVARPFPARGRISGEGAAATLAPNAAITLGLMLHEWLQAAADPTPGATTPRIRAHWRAGALHLLCLSPTLGAFGADGDDFTRRLFDHAVRHEFGGRWSVIRRKKGAAVCFEFPHNHRTWTRSGAVA